MSDEPKPSARAMALLLTKLTDAVLSDPALFSEYAELQLRRGGVNEFDFEFKKKRAATRLLLVPLIGPPSTSEAWRRE